MKKPPIPADEALRQAKLDSLGIIYSPAEERFDRITKMARTVFGVPIALVSLVSEKCQWFKSAQGLTALVPRSARPGNSTRFAFPP